MNKEYAWRAIYEDGSVLKQFPIDDGSENSFSDIDLGSLDVFVISTPEHHSGLQVNVSKGVISLFGRLIFFGEHDSNRLIYFRRKRQVIGMSGNASGDTLHCFGIQATVNDSNKKLIFGFSESSGQVVYVDN